MKHSLRRAAGEGPSARLQRGRSCRRLMGAACTGVVDFGVVNMAAAALIRMCRKPHAAASCTWDFGQNRILTCQNRPNLANLANLANSANLAFFIVKQKNK